MKIAKGLTLFLAGLFAAMTLAGCSGASGGNADNQSSEGGGKSSPILKSANETETWPGADIVITLEYTGELTKEQVKVTVGELEAEVESCINNQVRFKTPNEITAGSHDISAQVDGKKCEGSVSVKVVAPVIKLINTYSTGGSVGIDTDNIKDKAATLKVYLNGTELAYSYLTDLGSAGKYSIVADLPKGTKSGEIYISYGVNKSNAMSFTME